MSKILKPRRGTKTTMEGSKKNTVLAAGEVFFESNGNIGASSNCALKLGDGSTPYYQLPYFINGDIANVTISSVASNASTTITACLNNVAANKSLSTVLGALKQALTLTSSQFDDLNSALTTVDSQQLFTNSYSTIKKYNRIVTIDLSVDDYVSPIINANIPSKYRPTSNLRFPIVLRYSDNNCYLGYIVIRYDGTITIGAMFNYPSLMETMNGGATWRIQAVHLTYIV